jgi:hypothetical protein
MATNRRVVHRVNPTPLVGSFRSNASHARPTACWSRPAHIGCRRGALLLEVVVALVIMVATLAVLGAQLRSGLLMMYSAEEQNRGIALVDRLLALMELDLDLQQRLFEDAQREGDFGEQYPGYFWRLSLAPLEQTEFDEDAPVEQTLDADFTGLFRLDIEILFDRPDFEDELGSIDEARSLYTAHLIRAAPPRIDMTEDFGIPGDQLEQLQAVLPDFDPEQFNPQVLITQLSEMIENDPTAIMALLPMIEQLMAQFGGSLPEGQGNPGLDALRDLLGQSGGDLGGALGGMGGAGGELEAGLEQLRELEQQLGGGAGGAAGPGGGGRGPRGVTPGQGGNRLEGGRRGGNRGGAGDGGDPPPGEPEYTIEDLMRLQEELQSGGGR